MHRGQRPENLRRFTKLASNKLKARAVGNQCRRGNLVMGYRMHGPPTHPMNVGLSQSTRAEAGSLRENPTSKNRLSFEWSAFTALHQARSPTESDQCR